MPYGTNVGKGISDGTLGNATPVISSAKSAKTSHIQYTHSLATAMPHLSDKRVCFPEGDSNPKQVLKT